MIATKLTLESRIKDIRFAPDPRSEYVELVKVIVKSIMDEALPEADAPGYLLAAYQELELVEKFRKEREEHG